jgi:hypothetical protein
MNVPVPRGIDHFTMVYRGVAKAEADAIQEMVSRRPVLTLIGTCLAALYEVATCNRKCFGDAHIFEALMGRSYNLGCSAFLLIDRAFYDEALNLVRSLGEISNLALLSTTGGDEIREWIHADRKTRLKKFSPAKVRERLIAAGYKDVMVADDSWYADFCELYTHPTPATAPNKHNGLNRGVVGGSFQASGLDRSLSPLADTLGILALLASRFAGIDEYHDEIKRLARNDSALAAVAEDK